MAASKEAIALVLDVGQNMNAPANEKNDTYLDLALDSLQWIVSRKIFTEAKDEIALILFGSEETNNPLAEDDQYQNISIARELQLPDFDFIKFIQNEIRTTEKEGDWLDALVIAMEVLKEGTEGKKIGMQSITLFSNLGGDFSEDQMGPIAKCLLDNQIELNIIGPSVNLSKSWADHHISVSQQNSQAANGGGAAGTSNDNSGNDSQEQYSKKTDTMKHGEEVVRKLYACGLEGECYTPGEALRMLSSFQKRNVRPMPWKVQLEIGENTQIPVCLYLRTKGNKLKQTWRKMDPTNPNSDVGMDRTYIRVRPDDNVPVTTNGAAGKFSGTSTVAKKNDGGAGTEEGGLLDLPTEDKIQVDKEELVKGYKFGTTIVPFSEADLEAMKYKGEGKCFQLIGFADKHREIMGNGTLNLSTVDSEPTIVISPPEPLLSDYVQIAYLTLFFLIGAPLNLCAYTVLREKEPRGALGRIHLLKRHLNYSDLMVLMIYVPSQICWILTYDWRGGRGLCKIVKFLHSVSFQGSSNVIVCIAFDRLMSVLRPNSRGVSNPKKIKKMVSRMLFGSWGLAALLSLPQLFIWDVAEPIPGWYQCGTTFNIQRWLLKTHESRSFAEELFLGYHLVFVFWVPLFIITVSYMIVACWVFRNARSVKSTPRSVRILSTPTETRVVINHDELIESPLENRFLPMAGNRQLTDATDNKNNYQNDNIVPFDDNNSLQSHGGNLNHHPKSTLKRQSSAKNRAIKISCLLVAVYVVCWLPYQSLSVWRFVDEKAYQKLASPFDFLHGFVVLNSVINPFFYGMFVKSCVS